MFKQLVLIQLLLFSPLLKADLASDIITAIQNEDLASFTRQIDELPEIATSLKLNAQYNEPHSVLEHLIRLKGNSEFGFKAVRFLLGKHNINPNAVRPQYVIPLMGSQDLSSFGYGTLKAIFEKVSVSYLNSQSQKEYYVIGIGTERINATYLDVLLDLTFMDASPDFHSVQRRIYLVFFLISKSAVPVQDRSLFSLKEIVNHLPTLMEENEQQKLDFIGAIAKIFEKVPEFKKWLKDFFEAKKTVFPLFETSAGEKTKEEFTRKDLLRTFTKIMGKIAMKTI